MVRLALLALLLGSPAASPAVPSARPAPKGDHIEVRGITVSTPTWGWEWGTPEMDRTLDVLVETGANWVAIHPYAQIHADGRVTWRKLDRNAPPDWLARPIAEAHRRGLKVMIKPHLAYWGTRFSWRGDIRFDDPAAEERFFRTYGDWITEMAEASATADAFVVGTELDRLTDRERDWRAIIGRVRAVNPGHLTYAANWDAYERVPFWDALDAVGIQAYFPVIRAGERADEASMRRGWTRICADLRRIHARTGKPIVFTELGYDASPTAALEPWKSGRGDPAQQRLAMRIALDVVRREEHIRGSFLWKWFPGELQRGDFRMSRPDVRAVVRDAWARE